MERTTTDFSFETGMAILSINGIFCLFVLIAGIMLWRGFQNMVRLWAVDTTAKSMSFSKFFISYISGGIFNKETDIFYEKSRNQFSMGIGFLFIGFVFLVYANEYLYGPIEKLFSNIPHLWLPLFGL